MKVGVLAVQGDFEAHGQMLERLGVEPVYVRSREDLEGLDGVILPGGESTTHIKFLEEEGLGPALREFAERGGAIFGTCAGAILLAKEVRNPSQASLGLLDITISRNAYGRQVDSDVRFGSCRLKDEPVEMVFIRAPIINETRAGVEVLAENEGLPVMVQQDRVLASTFHPELTGDSTVHEYFLRLARSRS